MSALLLASRKGMMEMDMTCLRCMKPYPPGKKQGTFKMVGKMGFPFFKGYVGKMAPEIRWLEDVGRQGFLLGRPSGRCYASFRECKFLKFNMAPENISSIGRFFFGETMISGINVQF